MKTYLKQLILVIVITFVGFQDVHSQFREFKGTVCNGCIENTENVCRCKPTQGDLNHRWSKDEWADMGGGIGGVIRGIFEGKKARRRFVAAFERELGSELRNIVDINRFNPNSDSPSVFDRRPPTPREVQLGLFNTWSLQNRITVPGQNNARIAYNNFVKQTNDFVKDFDRAATEVNALEQRRQEIVAGNLDNAYLNFYSVEGQILGNIKTLAALDNLLGKSRDKYLGLYNHLNPLRFSFGGNQARYNLVDGLNKMNYGLFEYHLANQYVREYEKFKKKDPYGAANRLRDFIMAHKSNFPLTSIGNAQISELHRVLLNAGRVYYRSPNDAAYRETRKLGVGVPPHTPTPRSLEAIHENQVYESLGTAANDYIKSYPNVQEAIDKYFKHYDYNKASQDCVNFLFQKITGSGNFDPNINDYKSNGPITFRNASATNTAIDMEWKPSSIDIGYQGFQNIMAELNSIPENHQKIGYVIRDIMRSNGREFPAWMNDLLIGRYFNFRIVPVNSRNLQIDFRDGFGADGWNEGLTTNDGIYSHVQRLEFVTARLSLDTKQRDILLNAGNFVKGLFDFLNNNLNNPSAIEFGKQAVNRFNEGGDVDFDCNDPQPDKLSFCKKVWYLDNDGDGYYSEMKEAETKPGVNWFENLNEKDCDDNNPSVFKLNRCKKCETEPEDGKCTDCPEGYALNDFGDCKKKCPDEDRKKDSNDGFFTEIRTINGEDVAVKKATFSVNTVGGLSQLDINEIAEGVSEIYANGGMPMDLEMNVDEDNSDNDSFKIKFITDKAQRIELNETTWAYDFTSGITETSDKNGNITVSVVRNLNLFDENGKFIRVVVFDNEAIAGTLSHELGHALGLQHHWIDFPDKNTEENKFNFMNSEDNPDEELKTVEGENILPEQKSIIENKLKQQQRDGNDC